MTVERYWFNTLVYAKHETIDQYLTELKLLAKNCILIETENRLVRDRIVCGMQSEEVHQGLLCVEDLSLEKVVSFAVQMKNLRKVPNIFQTVVVQKFAIQRETQENTQKFDTCI